MTETAMVVTRLDSLEAGDEAAISAAWSEEIRQRRNEIRSGAVKALPWAEAKARLSAL